MTRLALGIVIALLSVGAALGDEETALRYRFKAGEKIVFVAEATTTIDVSAAGRTTTSRMTQLIDITWQVGAVDADGKASVTQTIDRIRFEAVTPKETVEYDTADRKAPDDPQARRFVELLNALAGARLGLTMDARGQFADFKAPERAGGDADPSSEAGFRHLMGQLIPVLPNEGPARGQTWSVKREGRVRDVVMSGANTYTYIGREDHGGKRLDKVTIGVSMKREPDDPTPVTVKGYDGSGAAYLDRAAGRVVESSLTRTMEFEAGAGDARLTRKVTETITLKLAGGAK